MTRYHLDTTAFSALVREDPAVTARMAGLAPEDCVAISSIVRGEVRFGIERLPASRRRRALAVEVERWFDDLASDEVSALAADRYGTIKRVAERRGTPLAENDLWIAAVALVSGSTLVTFDRDFDRIPELMTENWMR